MSDLLMNVSLARKSLQKKRQLRSKELSLNFVSLYSLDTDRSKTERNQRNRSQDKSTNEVLVTSPLPPRRFEFQDSVSSPVRMRSYKLDAASLLVGQVSRYLNKHFLTWKKIAEQIKAREIELFKVQGKRLKVSVGRMEKDRVLASEFAGKIVRNSSEFSSKILSGFNSNAGGLSDDDFPVFDKKKGKVSPRYNRDVERGFWVLGKMLRKANEKIQKETFLNIKQLRNFGKIRNRLAKIEKIREEISGLMPEETSSPSLYSDSRAKNKEVFAGCLQNLRDFINDKKEKQGKGKMDLEKGLEKGLEKISAVDSKVGMKNAFEFCMKAVSESVSYERLVKLLSSYFKKLVKSSFEKIRNFPFILKKTEKLLKNLIKNLSRDFVYRVSIGFKQWKTVVKSNKKYQEEFSLTAVTIHNILLNIINCRTKVFFSTYKLAMIKYKQRHQEKYKTYSKAINRLALCLRHYKIKPFNIWKYSKSSLKSTKKYIFRLDRSIKELLFHNYQFSFSSILLFAKRKTQVVRGLVRIINRSLHEPFHLFIANLSPQFSYIGSCKSFALNMKNFHHYLKSAPTKFSFKYLCHCVNRLIINLSFHHKSIKKNSMLKWKFFITRQKKVISIKKRYEIEMSQSLSASSIFNKLSLAYLTRIRFSFMKIHKAQKKVKKHIN